MKQTILEELIIRSNERELENFLIENPNSISEITSYGVSPLMLSCYYKKPYITSILLNFVKEISLFEASASGKFDEVAHLIFQSPEKINDYSIDGFTALGLASYFGREEVARYLVLKGADVNLASKNGYNIYPIHSSTAENFVSITKMLIENDAEVNVAQKAGITPLHSAALNGNIESIILLLQKGASVNAISEDGKKPADLANEKGFGEIAEILNI